MNFLYLIIEIVGVLVFLGIAFLLSKDKKHINWLSVGILFAINVLFAWFFLMFPIGQKAVEVAVGGFAALVNAAMEGITFTFGDGLISVSAYVDNGAKTFVFFAAALLPVLVIVPLFDILTYIGVLPFIIK